MIKEQDYTFLKQAISLSVESVKVGGYPVGAVLVKDDKVISTGVSNGKQLFDATLHAEIDAIRKASKKLQSRSLEGTTLYSSMEPCLMCFSASFWAYIPRIVYACSRNQLDPIHFMGDHSLEEVNKKNYRRNLELVHLEALADDALDVVNNFSN